MSSTNSIVPTPSSTTPGDTEPLPDLSTIPPGDAAPSPTVSTTPPRNPTSKDYSITKLRKKANGKLPDCMSKGETSYAMTKYRKRTTLEKKGQFQQPSHQMLILYAIFNGLEGSY